MSKQSDDVKLRYINIPDICVACGRETAPGSQICTACMDWVEQRREEDIEEWIQQVREQNIQRRRMQQKMQKKRNTLLQYIFGSRS